MLDDDWHAGCSPHWAERFRERQDAISERAALSDSLARDEIDDDGRFRLAELIEQIDGPIAGATAFDDVAKVVADPGPALSRQGIALLDAGQDAGLPLLEHAAERFPGVADRLYDHIIAYLEGAGRREEASRYRALLRQAQDISEQRRIEAEGIDEAVELRPLTDDVHAAAVASVVGVDGVRRLYVALRHLPVAGTDQLICVVQPGSGRSGQEVVGDVLARLAQVCDVLCIQGSRDRRWLVRRLEAVEGGRLV
ncbi:hypothetical protein ACU5AX_02060 [Sphingomonas sp. XXL09]|uniref:hypothetical protein n=1 Tax=Sphingomonas sp. XXL09 TaxID=3457787 RepID=UPI00406BA2E6